MKTEIIAYLDKQLAKLGWLDVQLAGIGGMQAKAQAPHSRRSLMHL